VDEKSLEEGLPRQKKNRNWAQGRKQILLVREHGKEANSSSLIGRPRRARTASIGGDQSGGESKSRGKKGKGKKTFKPGEDEARDGKGRQEYLGDSVERSVRTMQSESSPKSRE